MKSSINMLVRKSVVVVVVAMSMSYARATELDTWQSKLVDKVEPSVVHIKVGKASGTGVIIDERGYIVTNNHVVGKAQTVVVRLASGKELTGKVIWAKAAYDLAVVRVDAGYKLPALKFADISTLKRGHKVLAIGHPYGYDFSVSDGIVAFLGRNIPLPTGDVLKDMIQITTPINPGNSGGPLFNEKGELVGINTAVRDGANNIAFAINANMIRNVLNAALGNLRLAGLQGTDNNMAVGGGL